MPLSPPLSENQTIELARHLEQARLETREVERLTLKHPELSLSDAYRIMNQGIDLRKARGERQIGLKMGLTSEAKRKQMNLDSPIYGVLTESMQLEEGASFSLKGKIHPKIEPEIAFVMRRELRGKVSAEEALQACSGVCAAMEILDSRYLNFKYFSLPDVVADNSSSSHFVLGRTVLSPQAANWAALEMSLEVNGKPAQSALSSAISGDPVNSIIELCALLDERGEALPAGSIVLAGAATQAVQLESGMKIRLSVQTLGTVTLTVGE
jgi:2-oxo-3-hexenedioate decarboxylase